MEISLNWLKQYIDLNISVSEIANILTNTGLEVEEINDYETVKGGLEGFVIGEVLTCVKHPDADRLSVTTVNIGKNEPLTIVCGAPNVAAGQKVAVATEGTTIYMGKESFKIKKTKIRGQISEGMICAEDELGLGKSHDGIMVLDADAIPGTPLKEYFKVEKDTVFTIGLTPNRIDSASHFGVARDLYAFLSLNNQVNLRKPSIDNFKPDNNNYTVNVEIINTEACPRYSGVTVTGVTIKPSPDWLQNRLKAIGLNPINNVVDITNYILHEIGQPLHAFDADKIKGKKIIVKTMQHGTPFTTLDGIERKLDSNDLVICNTSEPMALAGIFGGLESGISENTKNVFIESAYFNPRWVRRTAKRHGLNTDSSFRFERGTDPNGTIYALKRAATMIKELAGGEISSEIIDIYPNQIKQNEIDLNMNNIFRFIGKKINYDIINKILLALDFTIISDDNNGNIRVSVPSYRVDVTREADVVEEILRIYGYNNVEIHEKVNSTLSYVPKPDKEKLINAVSEYLTNNGFNEIMTLSITKAVYYEKFFSNDNDLVHIINPLSSDLNVMRQTLLFNGLETILYNINRKNENLKLYEFGYCYKIKDANAKNIPDKYNETKHLAIYNTGLKNEPTWINAPQPVNFYDIKAFTENVLIKLGIDFNLLEIKEVNNELFNEALEYTYKNKTICVFGEVSDNVLKYFDIDQQVYYSDIYWDNLIEIYDSSIVFRNLPKYPEVRRDLALLIDKNVAYSRIKEIAFKTESKLLKRINLFDFYEGKGIPEDKKSYAISFVLLDEEKTLTDNEVDKVMHKLLQAFEKELGAKQR
jgi:phenylalanyl-tRNA synthetase beta chain